LVSAFSPPFISAIVWSHSHLPPLMTDLHSSHLPSARIKILSRTLGGTRLSSVFPTQGVTFLAISYFLMLSGQNSKDPTVIATVDPKQL